MDLNKLLNISTLAGKIMLESGAETYRVEETIVRIGLSFGVDDAESFVTPTGIITSLTKDSTTVTLVRRITSRGVDLNKIDLINNLSRQVQAQSMTVDELNTELINISQSDRYSAALTLFSSCAAAGCFALMFGGNIKDFFAAFIIGACIKIVSAVCQKLDINSFFINSLGGGLCAILAIILMKLNICANLDKTIIGSIMLLVPGLTITNAIRDTIAGDLLSGITKAAEAFLVAISIAVGTGAILSLFLNTIQS
ncbi:threonine/serine exporter family protein [Clostridium butyricum]|uniref:Threonine/serine exporter-like N-terminal domain-containing protein n=2 Tax=root TaxID=1 RepID=A0A2S7FEL3_CLOBU|nr:threonine/serine exporter family protein [Clostridium butyricum]KHD16848.1 membrane protein [Clostridium butyricum]MBS5981084.1 threonine/serine exporter family protein [Clostridium butyricum]MBZ0312083.1 threonine/serine exporter family protein [Clostridium butyricum]MDU4752412.1 threonine/serine exporter family protein [Clostridium butyricum]MZI79666.1 threonine/serine exporter family protein [Clostridium butyricum]